MVDLFGVYRHKVDAKRRLALPAKFRKELSEDLVVTVDSDNKRCLYIFTPEDYKAWSKSFFNSEGYDPSNDEHVKLRTKLRARAASVELDAAGRVNLGKIDPKIVEAVEINTNVVLIGNEGYIEVWDEERYEKFAEELGF